MIAFFKTLHCWRFLSFCVFSFFLFFGHRLESWPPSFSELLKLIIVRSGGNWKITKAYAEQICVCCASGQSGLPCSHCLGFSVKTVIRISAEFNPQAAVSVSLPGKKCVWWKNIWSKTFPSSKLMFRELEHWNWYDGCWTKHEQREVKQRDCPVQDLMLWKVAFGLTMRS